MRRRPTNNTNQKPNRRDRHTLIPAFDPKELATEIEQEANRTTSSTTSTVVSSAFDPSSYARIVEDHISVAGAAHAAPNTIAAVKGAVTAAAVAGATATTLPRRDSVIRKRKPGTPVPKANAECCDDDDVLVEVDSLVNTDGADDGVAPDRMHAMTMTTAPAPPPPRAVLVTEATEKTTETIGREMYSSYLASDFPEALVLAERLLACEPDHALAQLVLDRCEERLQSRSGRILLRPSSVLRLKFSELDRQSSRIDPTSSSVLGHIDGISNAATVAAWTGLDNADALARLHALLDLGVLELVSI